MKHEWSDEAELAHVRSRLIQKILNKSTTGETTLGGFY